MPNILSNVLVNMSAGDGNQNVTVPAGCDGIVACWDNYEGAGNNTSLATLTLNAVTFSFESQVNSGVSGDIAGCGVAIIENPATGLQNVAWTWSSGGARSGGGALRLVFLEETNIGNAVRDSGAVAEQFSDAPSIDLTTETTDLVIGFGSSFSDAIALTPTEFVTQTDTNGMDHAMTEVTAGATTTTVTMTAGVSYAVLSAISLIESTGTTITGTGAPAAQSATASGVGDRELSGSGTPAAQAAAASGVGEREIPGSGAPASQSATVVGNGVLELTGTGVLTAQSAAASGAGTVLSQITINLTVATSRELRDETGTAVSSLNNIAYEWYDNPSSTAGEPLQTGTFNTNATGEASFTVNDSTLADGEFGQLIIYHPSDPDIRATLRIPVST